MAKSSSIIIGIAALLLFQHHSALQAEAPRSIPVKWTVTKSGWMNLRKMQSNVSAFNADYWYICGQRKILAFWQIQKPEDDTIYDVLGKQPEIGKEFFGSQSMILPADDFIKDQRFLASASTACASATSVEPPPWMNLTSTPNGDFFYLLPRDFLVNGPIRTFWVTSHPSRKVTKRSKMGDDGKSLLPFGFESREAWLVKYSRNDISRIEISCNTGQYRTLYRISYDDVRQSITRPTDLEYIAPDTVADAWREVVCLIK